ncbi:MAG: RIP metalloprotease RseP [Oleiphilus sp.]|nr:MAG: RIP metalloprotease RseP [Oleiphilus sp.]
MEALESVISLIITLGILVTIHEYGHYWVAKRCGVKVLRFSVGFGRPIYRWNNAEGTEFCIAMIPLGGYVKMLDEREAPVDAEERSQAFNNKTVSQRIAIASAGPLANFMFAVFAYWIMAMIGFSVIKPVIGEVSASSVAEEAGLSSGQELVSVAGQHVDGWRDVTLALVNFIGESGRIEVQTRVAEDPQPRPFYLSVDRWLAEGEQQDLLASLGIRPERPLIPAEFGVIVQDSPAYQAGLKVGDRVLSAENIQVEDWYDLVEVIEASPNKQITIRIEREEGGDRVQLDKLVRPEGQADENGVVKGKLGIGVAPFAYPEEMIRTVQLGPIGALVYAADQTWLNTVMTLNAIQKMLVGLLSLDNLSGPITIAQVASKSISSGIESFLSFLALLSVSLGVLNLLPIPVLDGGHILYYLLEGVRGKPIPESWQLAGLKIGISFVVALMAIAFYNDIMRL